MTKEDGGEERNTFLGAVRNQTEIVEVAAESVGLRENSKCFNLASALVFL